MSVNFNVPNSRGECYSSLKNPPGQIHKLSLSNEETDDAKWNSSPDAEKPGNYFKFK